jgi:hypothetical protein
MPRDFQEYQEAGMCRATEICPLIDHWKRRAGVTIDQTCRILGISTHQYWSWRAFRSFPSEYYVRKVRQQIELTDDYFAARL